MGASNATHMLEGGGVGVDPYEARCSKDVEWWLEEFG